MIRMGMQMLLAVALAGAAARAADPPATQPAAIPSTAQSAGEAARERWNKFFGEPTLKFNTQPNGFLLHCLDRLPKSGAALDVACGQGRNAIPLAMHGLETTGMDISDVALQLAAENAKKAEVKLTTQAADVFAYDYGDKKWDVISIIYFNPAKPIVANIKNGVKPGGFVLIEGFGVRKQGGPPDESKYGANELLALFSDWTILEYQDGEFDADWPEKGKAHVVRLLAQRPR
ncbi:putative S-adenosyl-L-methionine-dependent methyltransferase TehB [Phycisphaerae bacterium RAS1]|nr:putative S-adenosyl-L-methionine-dependent methyltransferase TehB [Phycisphaerae bacterium RAS1]